MTLFKKERCIVFEDGKWLQPLSDPPGGVPQCREGDLKLMASLIQDVFRTGQARNLFVFGPPGTGKTVCARYLLREIQAHADETKVPVATAYVNAGSTRNPYYTMLEIVKQLGLTVPDSGWQLFRLKRAFENLLKDKSVVVAIDEVESILFKEKEPLVYYLNRQPKTTLILISNRIQEVAQLPERSLSTLQPKIISLEPYTQDEIYEILKARAEHAFKPNVISDELLKTIAEATASLADIRLGLSILLTAGLSAERDGRTTIDSEDVEYAMSSESKLKVLKKIDELTKRIERRKKC
jgi:cell division control protein 6